MPLPVIILMCILGVIVLLAVICTVRAVIIKKELPNVKPAISWTKQEEEKYASHLSEMIKIPTVSKKQEEAYPEFTEFQDKLRELFPLFFQKAENHDVDGNILRRLPGSSPKKGALLLMGHQDVVPADGQSGWEYPPFDGVIKDGCVFGRGAMDCKSTVCCILEATEELLKEGFSFKEDLWFFSSRNEENSGGGSEAAVDYLKNKGIRLNVVMDEGGAVIGGVFPGLKAPCSAIGVVEKGFVNLKFTAKSAGGHASTPPKNSPIVQLSKFVAEVEKKGIFEKKLVSPIPEMFSAIAPYLPLYFRIPMGNLWLFKGMLKRVLPLFSPMAAAFVSTTAAFTMSGGSETPNVLPDSAFIICNMRPSVHQSAEESIAAIRKTADKYNIETEVLYSKSASDTADINGSEFKFLSQCICECLPDTVVTPYMMTGGTDSRRFEAVCDNVLRFTPTRLTSAQLAAMHAANENIGVSALAEGVKVYKYYIEKYNA
ncbi:MAG: M20/M25/M40 family metallo-hydrolase [Oscillospiraceae bacterium]|nr:M20/M25/M40 family metallo-hydrolase [Oscillospiraceae bacterium]